MATNNRVNSNFYQVGVEDANGNITGIVADHITATITANLGTVTAVTITGGSSGQVLSTDGTGNLSWVTQTGGSGVPGGTDTQVQYNDGGSFGGDAAFTWNKTNTTLTVSGAIDRVDSITFDTTATVASAAARMSWDDGYGMLQYGLKGGNYDLKIGEDLATLCYNGTGSTIAKGKVVYIAGAQGQRISVGLADNSSDTTSSKTFGMVAESFPDGSEKFVVTQGMLRNVNTAAYSPGTILWLGTSGDVTSTKPVAPAHLVFVGVVLKQNAVSGEIYVKPQNGYELDEIHNVLITNPVADNSTLLYDTSTSLWVNASPSTTINAILPSQTGNTGSYLTTDGSTASWDVLRAAGTNTQIQFNDGGVFGGNAGFTYNTATQTVSIGTTAASGTLALYVSTSSVITNQTRLFSGVASGFTYSELRAGRDATNGFGNSTGYDLYLRGGSGAGNGQAGSVYVEAGTTGASGTAGIVRLRAISSTGASTGTFTVDSSGQYAVNGSFGTTGQFLQQGSSGATWATPGPTTGGTGLSSYTTGDILYASSTNTLSKRTIGSTGQYLTVSGGVPTWTTSNFATVDDAIVYAIALS